MVSNKKRILIVTQYIYPETFKSTEMAFELSKRGYDVDVLTGIPNYPEGHYYKGYGLFNKRIEIVKSVTFYRCLQTPRKLLPGFLGISLNFLTFAINATLWVFCFFVWKKRYYAVIAHEPSPITQVVPACILGRLRNIPVFTWVQDIWPDSVTSTVGEKGKKIEPILQSITDWIYKNSTKILITSKGMIDLVNRTRDYSDKIEFFPQWSEEMLIAQNRHEEHCGIFNIMMAGSLNDGIGVPTLMSLCFEMKDDPVHFTFVGSGAEEQNMREYVKVHNLEKITFTGRKPFSEMPTYYAQADAMLLTLKETNMPHLKATIPARLQGYMSAGKPILAMIDGSAADVIIEADCGYAVSAGDYIGLANYIRNTVLCNKTAFTKKGDNARRYYLENYTKEMCIDNLIKIIERNE